MSGLQSQMDQYLGRNGLNSFKRTLADLNGGIIKRKLHVYSWRIMMTSNNYPATGTS